MIVSNRTRDAGYAHRHLILVLLIAFGTLVLPIPSIGGPNWTDKHDLGNRYEGIVEHPVAAGGLDLVSLTGLFGCGCEEACGLLLSSWFYFCHYQCPRVKIAKILLDGI
jgi:hypothetical protein